MFRIASNGAIPVPNSSCWLGVPQLPSDVSTADTNCRRGELQVDKHGWLAVQLSLAMCSSFACASPLRSLHAESRRLGGRVGRCSGRYCTTYRSGCALHAPSVPGRAGAATQQIFIEQCVAAASVTPVGAGVGTAGVRKLVASDQSDTPTLLHARTRASIA